MGAPVAVGLAEKQLFLETQELTWEAMRLLEIFSFLLLASLVLTAPAPAPQNGGQTAGLVTLNTMTLMPLLLAGAAFAKGYLIGNLKHRKVSSGHGGYGPPLGYNRVGYGYPSYHQAGYHQDPYPRRRVDDAVAEQPTAGGGVETLQQQYQRTNNQYQDQYQETSAVAVAGGSNLEYYQLPGNIYGAAYLHG